MNTLSSKPYKGARDIYPEDMQVRNYIYSTWRRLVLGYGYQEYSTPMLEPLEVYTAKSGEELANEQSYSFTDRGGRQVAIRPELTPSVSRMVAARRQEMAYPARLFNIANFMRYERPQRGREREFWQLNLDIFGDDSVYAEAEVISLGDKFMREFGAKPSMYRVRINNRQLVNAIMSDYLKLDAVQSQLMIRLLDRRSKISEDDFRDQAVEIFDEEQAVQGLKSLSILLSAVKITDLPDEVKSHSAVSQMFKLFELLETNQVLSAEFDISLMRGLDYYTGTVFEFFDNDPANKRSLFGGGRYDGLVGLFGAEPLSAVGMAPGLTMTEIFLKTHNLLPEFNSTTDLYIATLGENYQSANQLANRLRQEGVNVELDSTGRKLDRQLKAAVKKRIPYAIVVGDEEFKSSNYKLKNLIDNTQQELSLERIITILADYRLDSDEIDELLRPV